MMFSILSSFDLTSFIYKFSLFLYIMFLGGIFCLSKLDFIMKKSYMLGSIIMYPLLFMLIYLNLWGIIPYSMAITVQPMVVMSMGFLMWMLIIFSSLNIYFKKFFSHLYPLDSPMFLVVPLILIELTSICVRPLTLSFRLCANMTAGHIILTLMVSNVIMFFPFMKFIQLSITMFYILFESFICIIQGYIFFMLLELYMEEHI